MSLDVDPWETGTLEAPPFSEEPPPHDDELAEQQDDEARFETKVAYAVERIRVQEAARQRVVDEQAANAPPLDAALLAAVLARPSEPPSRVAELIPSDAGTLLIAQRKTGKTTITLNLARSLLTGDDFLDRFPVRPINGTVAFLNYEVSAHQLARWAADVDIDPERLLLVNLRGRRNPLAHVEDRAKLAGLLQEQNAETLIVDPFGRAYTGQNQNDAGEVGSWLADLDRFARGEADISDLILTAHAGWSGERTRGSSALEDWADSIITITRGKNDNDDRRFLRATGRDIDVDEDELAFDPETRHLTLTGAGSRRAVQDTNEAEGWIDEVVKHITEHPDITKGELEKEFKVRPTTIRLAAKLAVDQGLLQVTKNGRRHEYSVPTRPTPSRPNSSGTQTPESQQETDLVPTRPNSSKGAPTNSSHSSIGTSRTGRDHKNQCDTCKQPLLLDNGRTTCERCRLDTETETRTA